MLSIQDCIIASSHLVCPNKSQVDEALIDSLMFSIYRIYHHGKSEDFITDNSNQVLNLGKFFARVLVLAIFVLEPKMIMSHQADLVDGCGAGGRPSDYLSSSLSKGTSQCEPHTHVEMLRF